MTANPILGYDVGSDGVFAVLLAVKVAVQGEDQKNSPDKVTLSMDSICAIFVVENG